MLADLVSRGSEGGVGVLFWRGLLDMLRNPLLTAFHALGGLLLGLLVGIIFFLGAPLFKKIYFLISTERMKKHYVMLSHGSLLLCVMLSDLMSGGSEGGVGLISAH
jgi:fumarate reductase subunit C